MKKFLKIALLVAVVTVASSAALLVAHVVPTASAQVTTSWSVASTTALGQNAESNAAADAFNMIWIVTAITLGLAAFFFALRWLWNRIAGKH